MTINRLAVAAIAGLGLAAMPMAAQARRHQPVRHHVAHHLGRDFSARAGHVAHYVSAVRSTGNYQGLGITAPRSGTYGASGSSIGTVTAPSVGSYNWPSVGVTNAVPTWSNTNPPAR